VTLDDHDMLTYPAVLPDGNGRFTPCPELMTQQELIRYLRVAEISKAQDPANVVANLVRMHDLPCIHISKTPLYPLGAVRQWVREKTSKELRR
jgi:hypothetical protein